MAEKFEDLDCWTVARELSVAVYRVTSGDCCRRDFGFCDQIRRAAVSVMNNVAEGFDRGSKKDFVKFLYIARASAAEVRSMTYLGLDLGYLNRDQYEELQSLTRRCGGLTWGLIKSLRSRLNITEKIGVFLFLAIIPIIARPL
jgi:four helix bundle protein